MHLDVTQLIQSGGLIAIALIIFLESGLMIGFLFPGDTLLLSAGVFAAQGQFSVEVAIAVIAVAAILGDNTGYTLGRVMGKRLFRKKDGIVFRQEYVERAEKFYEKHGAKTMLITHFIPIVRSFAPLVAGVGKMSRIKFFMYDLVGVIVWSVLVTLLGYWFGSKIPNIDHYIMPVVGLAVLVSFGPVVWHVLGDKTARERLFSSMKRGFRKRKQETEE
jgi:membrane-associated protein